ncbi:MAG: hypothetical protein M1834_007483 [Cirrosporium novae-zelandiae]|nr:MAG: hypothetical protein M1834_007483 [Cirrosporium novae-zelandiae]
MRLSLTTIFLALFTTSSFSSDSSPLLSSFYRAVGEHVAKVRSDPSFPTSPTCDLASATPPTAPTPLPSPSSGLTLNLVAIGRGIQNYTCDLANSTATPVPVGALAALFNASCVASLYPDLLSMLPAIVLDEDCPVSLTGDGTTTSDDECEDENTSQLSPANLDLSGHHYFIDTTTPTFNLNASSISTEELGLVYAKKVNTSSAPSDAVLGQYGQGNGSVAWLFLERKSEATDSDGAVSRYYNTGKVEQIYRLNTAGGNAPENCTGMSAEFSVQYAADITLSVDVLTNT